jgi:peptide/nickel transport system substrate-binding protein
MGTEDDARDLNSGQVMLGGKRILAATLVLAAAGCTGGNSTPAGTTPVRGGTAVYALDPGDAPDYIFPFLSSQHSTVGNFSYFTQLMYRPLYWFGSGGRPVLNRALSLADPPTFHGRIVTITLKHYRWSNGTPVTAQDVLFWLHMMLAVPKDWGAGTGFPQNVTNIRAAGPATLTMTMKQAYSPTWFLYNELSQITPMPAVWDRNARGPADCTTTVRDCAAVYHYLDAQARDQHSYVGSPIWSIVDGPWRLNAFSADGHAAEAFPGPRLFDRRAQVAGDGQRGRVILRRLVASRAPEPQFTQGVQHGGLDDPGPERTGHLQRLPEAVRRGAVIPG